MIHNSFETQLLSCSGFVMSFYGFFPLWKEHKPRLMLLYHFHSFKWPGPGDVATALCPLKFNIWILSHLTQCIFPANSSLLGQQEEESSWRLKLKWKMMLGVLYFAQGDVSLWCVLQIACRLWKYLSPPPNHAAMHISNVDWCLGHIY